MSSLNEDGYRNVRRNLLMNRLLVIYLLAAPSFLLPVAFGLSEVSKSILLYAVAALAAIGIVTSMRVVTKVRATWVLAGISCSIVSGLRAYDLQRGFIGNDDWRMGSLTEISCIVLCLAGAIIGTNSIRPLRRATIVGSMPVCAYALVQSIGLDPIEWNILYSNRSFSTLGNPNILACFVAMACALAMCELVESIHRGSGSTVWVAVISLYVLVLFSSRSLSGVIAMSCAVVGVLASETLGSRRRWMLVGGLMCAAAAFAVLLLRSDTAVSWTARIQIWRASVNLIMENPIFGYGNEVLAEALRSSQAGTSAIVVYGDFVINKAHSMFLDLLVTGGVLKFGLFVLFGAITVLRSFKPPLLIGDNGRSRADYRSVAALLVSFLVYHLFNSVTIVPLSMFFIFAGTVVEEQRALPA